MRERRTEDLRETAPPTSTDLGPIPASRLADWWDRLTTRGWAVAAEAELGLAPAVRSHLSGRYFDNGLLRPDHPGVHADRERARDVLRYRWRGGELDLTQHDSIVLVNRSGFAGERIPHRVRLTDDVVALYWVRSALSLIPPPLRQAEGTFGVNLLRTRTTVVSGPHHDDEEFVVIYVVDRQCAGAETSLHPSGEPEAVAFRGVLEPGTFLVFRDAAFLHDVTPLQPIGSRPARRDAIIGTVDYPGTYGSR